MVDIDKLLERLGSPSSSARYEACELLRIADSITEPAVIALLAHLNDPNKDVADAARRALALHRPDAFSGPPLAAPPQSGHVQVEQIPISAGTSGIVQSPPSLTREASLGIEQLLSQLESERPVSRYLAVKRIAESPFLPSNALNALAMHSEDPDIDVANAANEALAAYYGAKARREEPTRSADMNASSGVPPASREKERQAKNQTIPTESSGPEPSPLVSFLLGIGLLVAIYFLLFVIVSSWTGDPSSLRSFAVIYQVGTMAVVTLLAVPGSDPQKRGCLRHIGIFILSVIPIAGWVVFYWAGKGIARSFIRS
jgi:hypothetical protein